MSSWRTFASPAALFLSASAPCFATTYLTVEQAQKMKLEINPVSGEKVQAIVNEIYETPKPIAQKVSEILGRSD